MAQCQSFQCQLSQCSFPFLMLPYHYMRVKGCGKVMRKDQYEVTRYEWMVMYEQQDVMEKWIWEDEKMKQYPTDDGQVE